MSRLSEQIGRRLKVARKAANYKSARDFSTQHNIPETTYSQHETGKRALKAETLMHYSRLLNVNPGWLLTGGYFQHGIGGAEGGPAEKRIDMKHYHPLSIDKLSNLGEWVDALEWDALEEVSSHLTPEHRQEAKEFFTGMFSHMIRLVQKLFGEKS